MAMGEGEREGSGLQPGASEGGWWWGWAASLVAEDGRNQLEGVEWRHWRHGHGRWSGPKKWNVGIGQQAGDQPWASGFESKDWGLSQEQQRSSVPPLSDREQAWEKLEVLTRI